MVKGIISNLDKSPWKDIEPLEAKIESKFLKTIYTGKSIAPFKVLSQETAIIPWDDISGVMDALEAENRGYTLLNNYLEKVERIWNKFGSEGMTFKQRINYQKLLEKQFPISKLKVIYTAHGSNVATVLVEGSEGIIAFSLYYMNVSNKNEGLYLEGILNSDCLIEKIKSLQSQGQWGPRHIHRHLLKPPIPKYDPKEQLHKDIVNYTKKIKQIVQGIELDSSWYFTKSRKTIRGEIQNTGQVWNQFNQLVETLLEANRSSQKAS